MPVCCGGVCQEPPTRLTTEPSKTIVFTKLLKIQSYRRMRDVQLAV